MCIWCTLHPHLIVCTVRSTLRGLRESHEKKNKFHFGTCHIQMAQTQDFTTENVRRRLREMGLTEHEAQQDAEILRKWNADGQKDTKPDLYGKGSEAKLKSAANEIFSKYKDKTSALAYGAGPLGALIFDKINADNYKRIQAAIDSDPIGSWGLLQNIDATNKTAIQILRGETSEQTGLLNNFFANSAANLGGAVKNVDATAENLLADAKNLTELGKNLTNPEGGAPWLLIGGAAVVALIFLKM
jgi:hypothetical protein